jgi:hypothetical protein
MGHDLRMGCMHTEHMMDSSRGDGMLETTELDVLHTPTIHQCTT